MKTKLRTQGAARRIGFASATQHGMAFVLTRLLQTAWP